VAAFERESVVAEKAMEEVVEEAAKVAFDKMHFPNCNRVFGKRWQLSPCIKLIHIIFLLLYYSMNICNMKHRPTPIYILGNKCV
jgi:hypothetical protein